MSGIRTQTSAADGKPLPLAWHMLPVDSKNLIEQMLQGHEIYIPVHAKCVWDSLSHTDRIRVSEHLRAKRQLSKTPQFTHRAWMEEFTPFKVYSGGRQGGKSQLRDMIFETHKRLAETGKFSLYTPPNGGKRMLPSMYGRLRDVWIRKSGVAVKPEGMNDGHLENSLKLLNESHGNTVARATELLGKMARHFQNQPGIVHMLTELCEAMQTVDVDEMYPIFKALAAELEGRRQTENLEPVKDDLFEYVGDLL